VPRPPVPVKLAKFEDKKYEEAKEAQETAEKELR
jgi:hypothetical protein